MVQNNIHIKWLKDMRRERAKQQSIENEKENEKTMRKEFFSIFFYLTSKKILDVELTDCVFYSFLSLSPSFDAYSCEIDIVFG